MQHNKANRDLDVVVFGATSFVGEILCRHLDAQFGSGGELNWAPAARSRAKLDRLRGSLNETAGLEFLVANAADEASLRRICERTRVVISTVGPYALYGEPLIRVCAETGTDYCDLSAEFQWIRRMIANYEKPAADSGARILHCCGFDSIPSDLGVLFLQQQARARYGETCTDVRMRVKAMRGGFSGGTVASMVNIFRELAASPSLRQQNASPYSLCPSDHSFNVRQRTVRSATYDSDFDRWTAPFLMSPINTRVVHRSNALSANAYGENFKYEEAVMTGRGLRGRIAAHGIVAGLGGFAVMNATRPTRWALGKLLPAPGEGPDADARARGFFDVRFVGRTAPGDELFAKVTGDMDPGYGSTAKMLAQAGACLAQDMSQAELGGGFWTPATAFGQRLIDRLQANAGLTFELLG